MWRKCKGCETKLKLKETVNFFRYLTLVHVCEKCRFSVNFIGKWEEKRDDEKKRSY